MAQAHNSLIGRIDLLERDLAELRSRVRPAPPPRPQRRPRSLWRRPLRALALSVAIVLVPTLAVATDNFSDVPDDSFFHDDVNAIFGAGITTGCGGSLYCPELSVTRGQMASFLHRSGSRVASDSEGLTIPLTGEQQEILSITVQYGTETGGTAYVLVAADVGARITSMTGCPCGAQFGISGRARTVQIHGVIGGFGVENASFHFVEQIPTGVPVTYTVTAAQFGGTGTVLGGGNIVAITAPFQGTP